MAQLAQKEQQLINLQSQTERSSHIENPEDFVVLNELEQLIQNKKSAQKDWLNVHKNFELTLVEDHTPLGMHSQKRIPMITFFSQNTIQQYDFMNRIWTKKKLDFTLGDGLKQNIYTCSGPGNQVIYFSEEKGTLIVINLNTLKKQEIKWTPLKEVKLVCVQNQVFILGFQE